MAKNFECLNVKANQTGFARLVGVSQQAISDRVFQGVLKDDGTYAEWLHQYCTKLREEAAGRSGEEQAALTKARTRESTVSADLKELQALEKAGQLVPAEAIESAIASMITAAKTELLSLPDKLASELKALHDVDIDPAMIEEHIHAALNHLATQNPSDIGGDDEAGTEEMGAAA